MTTNLWTLRELLLRNRVWKFSDHLLFVKDHYRFDFAEFNSISSPRQDYLNYSRYKTQ